MSGVLAGLRPLLGWSMAAVALAAGPWAHADVYKWVDAQGRTHYSDLPPTDGSKANVVGVPPTPRGSTGKDDAPAKPASKSEATSTDPHQSGAKGIKPGTVLNAEDAATTRQRAENCDRARTELGVLQGDSRVFTTDARGMRQYIDDDSRAARIAELQRQLPVECN